MAQMLTSQRLPHRSSEPTLAVGLLWAYWPALTEIGRPLVDRSGNTRTATSCHCSPRGFPVAPLAACGIYPQREGCPGVLWGLPLLSVGIALHMAGNFFYFDWVSEASLLVSLAGLCVCLGGWPLARLAAPSIAFLAFMLPLPYAVEVGLRTSAAAAGHHGQHVPAANVWVDGLSGDGKRHRDE